MPILIPAPRIIQAAGNQPKRIEEYAARVNTGPAEAGSAGSRTLIVVLLVVAAIVALLPVVVARTRRVQTMRADLIEVLQECRVRYDAARTAADTAAADRWQPSLHGAPRPGDPPCGPYRRRNMLERVSR